MNKEMTDPYPEKILTESVCTVAVKLKQTYAMLTQVKRAVEVFRNKKSSWV